MAIQGRVIIRKFGRLLAVALLVALVSTGMFRFVSTFFAVGTIEIQASGIAVQIDETKLVKNLLFFPSEKVRLQILAGNPLIKDVTIRKKFPHTLIITIIARKPAAFLITGGQSLVLDSDGVILPQVSATASLPTITIDVGRMAAGSVVADPRVKASLRLIEQLPDPWKVQTITSHDSTSLSARIPGSEIIFTQQSDTARMVTTLQTLLTGFRIKGRLPKIIDLRFDKPVVTF